MHDKLKLLLDRINLPKEYYDAFLGGKILKLKLDSTRKRGVFIIEVPSVIEKDVIDYVNDNMSKGFPDMISISAEFMVSNIDYDEASKY